MRGDVPAPRLSHARGPAPRHDVSLRRRANAGWVPLLLLALLAGCAHAPPGIATAKASETDRAFTTARPDGWRRIAVIPFGGDPAHRRPAEELVAVSVWRMGALATVMPFAIEAAARSTPRGAPALEPEAWSRAYLQPDGEGGPPREAVRAAAAWLAADALVLGAVASGGSSADLVLVDGGSGEAVLAVRRAGSAWASQRGVHALAMSSVERALEALLEALRTRPGEPPRVHRTRTVEPLEQRGDVP